MFKRLHYVVVIIICALTVSTAVAQQTIKNTPAGYKFTDVNQLQPVVMPMVNVDSLMQEDDVNNKYKEHPYRFGYNHFVNYNFNNSGAWTVLPGIGKLWQLAVKCPGALTVNFGFSNVSLPQGATLYVYSKDFKQVLGPYTAANSSADKLLGSELINGDEAVIEYYEPAAVAGQGRFDLFRVTHGYRGINNYLRSFGDAGGCMNNVNCPQYADWVNQKRSVVCLVSGGNEFCSGSLINNTRNDGTPYMLTANHCGPADGTWVFRFNWEAPGCANPTSNPTSQSVTGGGVTVANNTISDFLLVRMNTAPPVNFNVYYNGWSRDTVPATSGTGIHHPSGDIKKLSQALNTVVDENFDGVVTWRVGQWTDGVTEGGSSGSPLYNQNKKVIGQLHGGPSSCSATGADKVDYYGKFYVSWDTGTTAATRLRDWLDPDGTDSMEIDGYDPNIVSVAYDAVLNSIPVPAGSSCDTTYTPVVQLFNHGIDTIHKLTILYSIDNGATMSYTWTGQLASLHLTSTNLPAFSVQPGTHTYFVNITAPDDSADANTANDTLSTSFTVIGGNSDTTPIAQSFETSTFPPVGWTAATDNNGRKWTRTTNANGFGTSQACMRIDEYPLPDNTGEIANFISPFITLANDTDPAYIAFDVAYGSSNNYHDSLFVLSSIDCGATWNTLYSKGGSSLSTATAGGFQRFVPTSSQWRRDSINISNLLGQPSVLINFAAYSDWGNDIYIDNINIVSGRKTLVTTGNQVLEQNSLVRVYPNPFAEAFTLELNLNASSNNNIGLYSIDGRLLQTIAANENLSAGFHKLNINTTGLSNGIYLLKVNSQVIKLEKVK